MTHFIQADGTADLRLLKLDHGNLGTGRKILRSRKAEGRASGASIDNRKVKQRSLAPGIAFPATDKVKVESPILLRGPT